MGSELWIKEGAALGVRLNVCALQFFLAPTCSVFSAG